MKPGTNNRSTDSPSPDENIQPSKNLFRKIFKKKSANLSFNTVKERNGDDIEITNAVRRSQTFTEMPTYSSPIFGNNCKSIYSKFFLKIV